MLLILNNFEYSFSVIQKFVIFLLKLFIFRRHFDEIFLEFRDNVLRGENLLNFWKKFKKLLKFVKIL